MAESGKTRKTRTVHYIDAADDAKYHYYEEKAQELTGYYSEISGYIVGLPGLSAIPLGDVVKGSYANQFSTAQENFLSELSRQREAYNAFLGQLQSCIQQARSLAAQYEKSRHRTRTEVDE